MKLKLVILCLGLASTGLCFPSNEQAAGSQAEPEKSQAPEAAQTDAMGSFRPGAGTIFVAELSKSLNAEKLKVDDPVECIVLQDLLYKGKIIVPRNSRALGRVVEVVRSSKTNPDSRVGLVFQKLILPNKKELPFQYPAIIIAVAAPIRGTTVQTTKITDMPVQMSKGKDTGTSVMGAVSSNAQLAGANMSSSVGALSAADRGVIGLKNVGLDNSHPAYSLLVAPKGNLKLDFDVQLVLQVTSPAKPQ